MELTDWSAPRWWRSHSEHKEGATSHYKGDYGFHLMFCFLDATGEALAGVLRPGNAAASSGADQLALVDNAIAQLPAAWQAGHRPGELAEVVGYPVLVRAGTAGAVRGFIEGLVERNCEFSVSGRVSAALDAAIAAVSETAWVPALDANATLRRGAHVVELDVTFRYRLLHTAGRLVHRSRQWLLRLPERWPWAKELAVAYQRVALLNA